MLADSVLSCLIRQRSARFARVRAIAAAIVTLFSIVLPVAVPKSSPAAQAQTPGGDLTLDSSTVNGWFDQNIGRPVTTSTSPPLWAAQTTEAPYAGLGPRTTSSSAIALNRSRCMAGSTV